MNDEACIDRKSRAVFFTTDHGYLVHTIVAALGVLKEPEVEAEADVIIFLVDFLESERSTLTDLFSHRCMTFISMSSEHFSLPAEATFHHNHVPRSALARLAAGQHVPVHYRHLVYIDGDTQVIGSILPLVMHDVPPGKILAACDQAYLLCPEYSSRARSFRQYMRRLGIKDSREYFNSGVIAAQRSTWIEVGSLALDFIRSNSSHCVYHDQSALNAVCIGRREALSPRYNFASWYADLEMINDIDPLIIHFTGGAKPWLSEAAPWYGRFRNVYREVLEQFPALRKYWTHSFPLRESDQPTKRHWSWRSRISWRPTLRRLRVRRYLRRHKFSI